MTEKCELQSLKTEIPLLNKKELEKKTKFKEIWNNITVEPVAVFNIASFVSSYIASETLYLEKACRVNLQLNDTICDALRKKETGDYQEYEKIVQQYIAPGLAGKSVIQSLIPCLMLIFVGAWSDLTGRRKVVMLVPIIADSIQSISNIINVIFFLQLRYEVALWLDSCISAIGGGRTVFLIATYSYIGSVSSVKNRTKRMGYVTISIYLGGPVGYAIAGVLLKKLGYLAVYGTCLSLNVLCSLYTLLKIPDPVRNSEQIKHDYKGVCYFLKTFFDLSNIKETLQVVFKRGQNKRRMRVCILLSMVPILMGPLFGEVAITYMSTRYRFNWDEFKCSIFELYNTVIQTIGTWIAIAIFSQRWKWQDSLVGIIATISKIVGSVAYCFALDETVFCVGSVIEILTGSAYVVLRSIVSKLVAADELGKVNSVFGLAESLMPMLYIPLYTKIYTSTMHVLPGAAFLIGGFMASPAIPIFAWLFYEHKKIIKQSCA